MTDVYIFTSVTDEQPESLDICSFATWTISQGVGDAVDTEDACVRCDAQLSISAICSIYRSIRRLALLPVWISTPEVRLDDVL